MGISKTVRAVSDRSKIDDDLSISDVADIASSHKIIFTEDQIAAAAVPNTPEAIKCYIWLRNFFDASGDYEPNRKEIHLDPITKREVHGEYLVKLTSSNKGEHTLEYSEFVHIWTKCFPHVKIREYKACSGKCMTCALFTVLMRKFEHTKALALVIQHRALHRADYMSDRILYQERVEQAEKDKENGNIVSIITDGMQQYHTELPYMGNNIGFSFKVKQHFQGITTHGHRTRIYRTVDHIRLGANANIYTILLALEEHIEAKGKVPKTLYIQIDGGPENANWVVLAWMEILITIDIGITEIWLCRLKVGHTHADQDARFGQLWKKGRTESLVTPKKYSDLVAEVLENYPGGGKLVDVFVVPDLAKAVEDCIDSKLCWAFKRDSTKHIFRFQKVEKSEQFPLGSKCTYRASAQNSFIEFVESTATVTGLAPRQVFCDWLPENGISILTHMPDLRNIAPQPFIEGSLKELHNSIFHIKQNSLIALSPSAIRHWNEFLDKLPRVDETAEMFVERIGGLAIPLIDRMPVVSISDSHSEMQPEPILDDYYEPSVAEGASVRWRGCLKPEPPRVTLEGRHDATGSKNVKKRRKSAEKAAEIDISSISAGTIAQQSINILQ